MSALQIVVDGYAVGYENVPEIVACAKEATAELAQLRAELQAAQERIAELEEPIEAFSLAHDLATASIDSPLLVRYAMQLEQRSAEQARQLAEARELEAAVRAVHDIEIELTACPVCNYPPISCECSYMQVRAWLAANPAPEAEQTQDDERIDRMLNTSPYENDEIAEV